VIIDQAILDRQIASKREAIRYQLWFVFSLVGLGVIVMLAGYYFPALSKQPEALKVVLNLGGGFISALASLPLKEVIDRKEKADLLETLKVQKKALDEAGHDVDPAERERIEALIHSIVEVALSTR
jgi:hypothetical protein